MELGIFVAVIGLLKDGHIIHATLVQIGIFIAVDRVNFYAYNFEILAGQLAGFANIVDITHFAAFACQNKDFLHAGLGDGLHFPDELLPV